MQSQKIPLIVLGQTNEMDKLNKIVSLAKEMLETAEALKNREVRLILPLKVSDTTRDYITTVFAENGDFRSARYYLNEQNGYGFEDHFTMDPSTISRTEIDDIEHTISFVRTAYHIIADEVSIEREKFTNLTTVRVDMPIFSFNPATSSIVLTKNPLQIDQTQFLEYLVNFDANNHYMMMMYRQQKTYETFKKMIIIVPR
jgi:hypothetical protein